MTLPLEVQGHDKGSSRKTAVPGTNFKSAKLLIFDLVLLGVPSQKIGYRLNRKLKPCVVGFLGCCLKDWYLIYWSFIYRSSKIDPIGGFKKSTKFLQKSLSN